MNNLNINAAQAQAVFQAQQQAQANLQANPQQTNEPGSSNVLSTEAQVLQQQIIANPKLLAQYYKAWNESRLSEAQVAAFTQLLAAAQRQQAGHAQPRQGGLPNLPQQAQRASGPPVNNAIQTGPSPQQRQSSQQPQQVLPGQQTGSQGQQLQPGHQHGMTPQAAATLANFQKSLLTSRDKKQKLEAFLQRPDLDDDKRQMAMSELEKTVKQIENLQNGMSRLTPQAGNPNQVQMEAFQRQQQELMRRSQATLQAGRGQSIQPNGSPQLLPQAASGQMPRQSNLVNLAARMQGSHPNPNIAAAAAVAMQAGGRNSPLQHVIVPPQSQVSNAASPSMNAASPPTGDASKGKVKPRPQPRKSGDPIEESAPPPVQTNRPQQVSIPPSQQPPSSVSSQVSHPYQIGLALPVPDDLHQNVTPAKPEAFRPPRPTLNQGLPTNPMLASPAIVKPPPVSSEASGAAGNAAAPQDKSADKSESQRVVTKRKLSELLATIDPDEKMEPEVEDLLLEVSDEFVETVTRHACKLATHRKSERLEVKDIQLYLERQWNMRIPGYASEDIRQSQNRRINLPAPHLQRLAAVRDAAKKR